MALKTNNADSIVQKRKYPSDRVTVRFNKTTFVESLGRDSEIGETAEITASESRFLIGAGKAEVVKPANRAEKEVKTDAK